MDDVRSTTKEICSYIMIEDSIENFVKFTMEVLELWKQGKIDEDALHMMTTLGTPWEKKIAYNYTNPYVQKLHTHILSMAKDGIPVVILRYSQSVISGKRKLIVEDFLLANPEYDSLFCE